MKVWLNGSLVEQDEAKLTVFDHGTLYGDGVFEGIRAYGGKIFQCDAHLGRLFRSAELIRLDIPFTKDEISGAMYDCLRANGLDEAYIRLVATRGPGKLGLNPFNCSLPSVFVIADKIALYPEQMYTDGLEAIIPRTVRTAGRMLDSKVKSLNYLNNTLAKIECIDAGVGEALMLNEKGNVCEATGANIFIVRDGRLITPPPEADILLGITRNTVMRLAGRLDIPVAEEDFTPAELYTADECFLTGTAAEIIAVTRVDGKTIGGGRAGPVTVKLRKAFRDFIKTNE